MITLFSIGFKGYMVKIHHHKKNFPELNEIYRDTSTPCKNKVCKISSDRSVVAFSSIQGLMKFGYVLKVYFDSAVHIDVLLAKSLQRLKKKRCRG